MERYRRPEHDLAAWVEQERGSAGDVSRRPVLRRAELRATGVKVFCSAKRMRSLVARGDPARRTPAQLRDMIAGRAKRTPPGRVAPAATLALPHSTALSAHAAVPRASQASTRRSAPHRNHLQGHRLKHGLHSAARRPPHPPERAFCALQLGDSCGRPAIAEPGPPPNLLLRSFSKTTMTSPPLPHRRKGPKKAGQGLNPARRGV